MIILLVMIELCILNVIGYNDDQEIDLIVFIIDIIIWIIIHFIFIILSIRSHKIELKKIDQSKQEFDKFSPNSKATQYLNLKARSKKQIDATKHRFRSTKKDRLKAVCD